MSINRIKLSKFGGDILPSIPEYKVVPLIGKKSKTKYPYEPISTDGKVIFKSGEYFELNDFFSKHKKVIVLTDKERSFLVDNICYQNIRVRVLEHDYPIYDDIRYTGELSKTHSILCSKINQLTKSKIYPKPIFRHFSDIHRRAIYRKIPQKCTLDSLAYFSDLKGYQEVFRLKEERKNKQIYALDFNSMYSSCIQGELPDPKEFIFKREGRNLSGPLLAGFYHVLLSKPNSNFIKQYHCFKSFAFAKNFSFQLGEQHELEVFITNEELDFYRVHFDDIYIYSSVTSNSQIRHPRSDYVERKYKQRHHTHISRAEKSILKSNLVAMHSSTNPARTRSKVFLSISGLIQYLLSEFQIKIEGEPSIDELKLYLNSFSGFTVLTREGKITLRCPDLNSPASIISISAFIVAKARIKLLQVMEHIASFKGADICYVNTDSVHVSIDDSSSEEFELHMKPFVGQDLGQLKIECRANYGFWLDVGRYWLCNENKILKCKNIIFNSNYKNSSFLSTRTVIKLQNSEFISSYNAFTYLLKNSFSYTKRLNSNLNVFDRYNYDEISSMCAVGNTLLEEKLSSNKTKIDLFHQVKERYSQS